MAASTTQPQRKAIIFNSRNIYFSVFVVSAMNLIICLFHSHDTTEKDKRPGLKRCTLIQIVISETLFFILFFDILCLILCTRLSFHRHFLFFISRDGAHKACTSNFDFLPSSPNPRRPISHNYTSKTIITQSLPDRNRYRLPSVNT